ncbi:hypothetical protein SDC9_114652 [bioreactor metagenome]|uniref:Uncharacterized protein n=1 Tax=bioreactor metagenome TaxID=1076179 RepID=A0A645BRL3_9ZZZZ
MDDIEITELFARSVDGCSQGEIGTLNAAEHDAGASAVFHRIDDGEAVIADLFDSRSEGAEVLFPPLIGPAAFPVGIRLVGKAAVGRLAEVEIRNMRFFIRKAQIERMVFSFRPEEQPDQKKISVRCVVFQPVVDIAGDRHISGCSRQYQGFDRPFVQQPLLSAGGKLERLAVPCDNHPVAGVCRQAQAQHQQPGRDRGLPGQLRQVREGFRFSLDGENGLRESKHPSRHFKSPA